MPFERHRDLIIDMGISTLFKDIFQHLHSTYGTKIVFNVFIDKYYENIDLGEKFSVAPPKLDQASITDSPLNENVNYVMLWKPIAFLHLYVHFCVFN